MINDTMESLVFLSMDRCLYYNGLKKGRLLVKKKKRGKSRHESSQVETLESHTHTQ